MIVPTDVHAPERAAELPLVRRFPALAAVPHVSLGSFPTPVQRVQGADGRTLWIKRDDLSGPLLGGNKVRPLEFLLAGVAAGDEVLTVGGRGSTHALTTALYAAALGARPHVLRWRQEMNSDAEAVAARLAAVARCTDVATALGAYARVLVRRAVRHPRWVPAGGTSALGALGHVNAALELAEQVRAGLLPQPSRIVVPLGSGGTAAGLALGFAIAGLDVALVAARVVPRVVANRARLLRLAERTAQLIERHGGGRVERPRAARVQVVHDVYGGAYGRATTGGAAAARWLREARGPGVDATYSAKALAAALALSHESLFWLTFDARWRGGAVGAQGAGGSADTRQSPPSRS